MATPSTPSTETGVTDTEGAAARLGVSPASLATWRCTGAVRIPHCRVGRRVIYRIADLDRFLADRLAGV